ncbi:MAG: imidazole glycerol phosphate synthase subunit HisH [Firmicutes bacterium HGW-Firmicutes-1]|jgi:glutamine amidotransferase|nr:MAG: imidazole glycerol phosphate synthase subunit HisH [Firmicutes bacterium HGW-Firmicutes-1]
MKVAIIDYGMCNLLSVKRAFEECGADSFITTQPSELDEATHIVLPGVGAFPDAMKMLTINGWVPEIQKNANLGIPILGICLGMQLLAEWGEEGERTKGLGLIQGEVIRFDKSYQDRIPHVGWNELHQKQPHPLFEGLPDKADFYFVHSYHFRVENHMDVLGTTPYCGGFVSVVNRQNIFGAQFHPEKSQRMGFKLIKNFLNYC